jgi:hypothetical protein
VHTTLHRFEGEVTRFPDHARTASALGIRS